MKKKKNLIAGVKIAFSFKQVTLNDKQKFESLYKLIDGERLYQ